MERIFLNLVRYAVAAELDVASLLLLLAALGDGPPLVLREDVAPEIPEHHYPH